MAAQVGHDDAEAGGIAASEHQCPVGADAGAAVQQQQRLAVAAVLVVQLKSVDVDDHGVNPTSEGRTSDPSRCLRRDL